MPKISTGGLNLEDLLANWRACPAEIQQGIISDLTLTRTKAWREGQEKWSDGYEAAFLLLEKLRDGEGAGGA